MEGDLEPVYWQGQIIDYVRKFDTRLQIEFLRSYMPGRFKRPGAQVNVGVKSDIFVLSEEQRHELQRINREWILEQHREEPRPLGQTQHSLCDDNARDLQQSQ